MPKRRIMIIIILAITLICILSAVWSYLSQRYYFNSLKFEEISRIQIYSQQFVNDKLTKKSLNCDDTKLVFDLIKRIELRGIGTVQYREYVPITTQMFIIELMNGHTIEVAASIPFYIVNNEKGFKADRPLCADIEQLYYELVDMYFP